MIQPPETAPTDAQGTPTAPTLTLTDCESLDTDGLLTPVSDLVSGIKALKADPDSQIFVGAIVAPASPYTIDWVPPVGGQNLRPGELWPQIEHSCASGDGSYGDPAVRITQLVKGFGDNGVSSIDLRSQRQLRESGWSVGLAAESRAITSKRGGGSASTSGAGGSGAGGAGACVARTRGGAGAAQARRALMRGASARAIGGSRRPGPARQRAVPRRPGTVGSWTAAARSAPAGPGASGLVLAGLFLLGARRRRASTRRAAPGAEKLDRKAGPLTGLTEVSDPNRAHPLQGDRMPLSPRSVPTVPIRLSPAGDRAGIGWPLVCTAERSVNMVGRHTAAVTAAATATATLGLGQPGCPVHDRQLIVDDLRCSRSWPRKIPGFMTALQNLPSGLPNVDIAVVSSDLGAPGDSTAAIGCTPAGNRGIFRTGGGLVSQDHGFWWRLRWFPVDSGAAVWWRHRRRLLLVAVPEELLVVRAPA